MEKLIEDSLSKLIAYCDNENYKGYDPYDTLNSWIPFLSLGKWPAVLATQFQKRNPVNIRPLLGIKKFHSTYGMGLLLKAYVKLYSLTKNSNYISSITFIKDWLLKNHTTYKGEICWGYDYPYATPNFVHQQNFPTVIHHSFIIDALYEYYLAFNDSEVKDLILRSEKFIINHIPQIEIGNGICLGYNPHSYDCTYNASVHAARCLAIADNLSNSNKNINLIKDVVNFVISKQKSNGVWYYSFNKNDTAENKQIDFHQGFILEALFDIMKFTGYNDNELEQAIRKGVQFYKTEQFFNNGQSKWRLPKVYPVDIHNQGQGIITFSKLKDYDNEYLSFAYKILIWSIENMQSKRGYFYYRNYRNYKNKIPYMRWSQAIMLLSFVEYEYAAQC